MTTRQVRWAMGMILLGLVSIAEAGSPPQRSLRLVSGPARPGGLVEVVLVGHNMSQFTAVAGDVWLDSSVLAAHQCRTRAGLAKLPFCSESTPGLLRFGLVGLNDRPMRDGALLRLQLSVAEDAAPGTYPISMIVSLARPDGSVLEVGPIGTSVRVRPGRDRSLRRQR